MEQQPHRAREQTTTKPSHITFKFTTHSLLFDSAHKQCNGIINEWLHCLTSESKGRLHVNNILMFDSD